MLVSFSWTLFGVRSASGCSPRHTLILFRPRLQFASFFRALDHVGYVVDGRLFRASVFEALFGVPMTSLASFLGSLGVR